MKASVLMPFFQAVGGGGYILDLYPNAIAAYALIKLSSSYSGACIRVRRSSDNAEQDINLDGDVIDEAALLSFIGANDGFVTKWYHQGGGVNVAQSNTAYQPRIVISGVTVRDGGEIALELGVSSYKVLVSESNIPITTNELSVISIGRITGGTTFTNWYSFGGVMQGQYIFGNYYLRSGVTLNGAGLLGSKEISFDMFDTSNSGFYKNSVLKVMGSLNSIPSNSYTLYVGAKEQVASFTYGYMYGFLAYDSIVSSQISDDLNAYYNIY